MIFIPTCEECVHEFENEYCETCLSKEGQRNFEPCTTGNVLAKIKKQKDGEQK